MSIYTDQHYLRNEQYRNADNLNARITIHQRFSTNPQGWFAWVWDVLDALPRQARVLEVGCGAGSLWASCPERIPAGWSITLSDLSDGMLDSAWRNLVVIGRTFKFEQFDVQYIPYPNETFDIIIANHMLYHAPNRPKAIGEFRRVLRPGGTLIAATGGVNHLMEMTDWYLRLNIPPDMAAFRNPFSLENGFKQLQPFFSRIEIHRYENSLRITEIPPLMDYLRSSPRAGDVPESAFAELANELSGVLQEKGIIHVTTDAGLFAATK